MQQAIKDLRKALEMQHAIQGTLIPLGAKTEASPKPAPPRSESVSIEAPLLQPVSDTIPAPSSTVEPDNQESTSPEIPADSMANLDLFGNEIDPLQDQSLSPYARIEALIPQDSPLLGMHSLEEVATFVANTILIPLDESRLNPVFGVGNPESDLMVIGEAPGADEDRQGEPFVGRAGQLLNKILGAINFAREDVYIANILKSRPPNNRDPQPEEVAAHIPILYKQISLIKPKIILCVGKTSGNNLLNRNGSLASLRGKFNDFYGIPVMVTYHPAALLRNPQWKRPTWEDVQLLRSKYDELAG